MATITIPNKLENEKDLIVIPHQEYKEFLILKTIFNLMNPTKKELEIITRGKKEIKAGKYISWHELKKKLASHSR